MKTIVTLYAHEGRQVSFVKNGRPSDVSDRIVRIKRAFKIRITHSVQAF